MNRPDNASPLTERADIEDCRRILGRVARWSLEDEIESYGAGSAEELGAMRDLELWGYDPFDLED